MSNHTIEDLRTRLFETIDGVKDGSITIEKAKTIGDLSQVIVNSAKTEVEYLRATGGGSSAFIEPPNSQGNPTPLPPGILGIQQHRLKG